jgi:AspT/YidE/YbjL antiporter-like protein
MLDTLWHDIVSICQNHPQLLVFLSLAIGYFVGKIKLFGFSLGSTASVLLAALALGQLDVTITPLIKSVAFALFIFTIGYKVGPQFFGGLKKDGLQYVILSLFVAIVGLITAVILGKIFSFNQGSAAGLMAGAMTQSSIIGTAEDAIRTLSITAAEQATLTSDIAIAYAITYLFGVAGLILFYKLVPKILGLDLKKEAQQLESQLSNATAAASSAHPVDEGDEHKSNIIIVGLGCFLGTVLGIATFKIGFVTLTLGMGGGILLVGLLFGWLQSKYPAFGPIPPAAQWILSDLGLNLFIACVGLTAGPRAIAALQSNGASLFAAGVILTLTPHILGLLFGKLVLRLDWVLLLGALTGAGTATPSLNVLKNECDSSAPALGYTVPYALGNFILTIWGTVIVMIM